MQAKSKCESIKNGSEIPLQENKSKFIYKNPNNLDITVIKVDGCMLKNEVCCDYMIVPNQDIEIYIELKGCDVLRAVKQIESTIVKLSKDITNKKKFCYVVSTRCPLTTTQIQQTKIKFKKKFKADFQVKNIICTHNI